MTDPLFTPITPDVPVVRGRRCKRHLWMHLPTKTGIAPASCARCGIFRDEARARRGRTARSRGNQIERDWCRRLGLRHTGQFGEAADGENAMFVGQCKSRAPGAFPGWLADELGKLAALRTGKTPILGIIEAAGPGHPARRLVVIDEADFVALHRGAAE